MVYQPDWDLVIPVEMEKEICMLRKNCSNNKFLFPSEQEEQNTKLKEMFRKKEKFLIQAVYFKEQRQDS